MIKYKRIIHNIEPLFEKLKSILGSDPEIVFAYCFGSYGKGRPHPLSDVDIALYLSAEVRDTFAKKLKLQEILSKILLTDEIDLVILNDAPVSLAIEVLRSGKLLASSDEEKRCDFEVRVMKEYLDTLWLRELSERSLIDRVRDGKYGYTGVH